MSCENRKPLASGDSNNCKKVCTWSPAHFALVSITAVLLLAPMLSLMVWKHFSNQARTVETHDLQITPIPEVSDSSYELDQDGQVISVTVKGKTLRRGMSRQDVTDLFGKPILKATKTTASATGWKAATTIFIAMRQTIRL
jgi:hypothetical protein